MMEGTMGGRKGGRRVEGGWKELLPPKNPDEKGDF
jgi:hypothetical protein